MLLWLSTTPSFTTHVIVEYKGMVNGEVILTTNAVKDWFAKTNKSGGRASGYEKELRRARDMALEDMMAEAQAKGANAIVSIDIDYQALGDKNNIMMVCAAGTAVVVQ